MALADLFLNIQFGWYIQFIGNIFSVLFPLSDAFAEQIFDLSVHRAKIILCPGGNCRIELGGEAERNLLFLILVHINTGFPSLQRVVHRDFRKERPKGWKPWRPFSPRPIVPRCFGSDALMPFPPYQPRRQRSFF